MFFLGSGVIRIQKDLHSQVSVTISVWPPNYIKRSPSPSDAQLIWPKLNAHIGNNLMRYWRYAPKLPA